MQEHELFLNHSSQMHILPFVAILSSIQMRLMQVTWNGKRMIEVIPKSMTKSTPGQNPAIAKSPVAP
jgi:hypothetical protein